MNAVVPSLLNPAALLEQAVVTIVTAKVIEQASGPAAQLAKATQLAAIAQDLIDINEGKLSGITGLQAEFTALVKLGSDPAAVVIIGAIQAELGTFVAQLNSQTLLGKLGGVQADDMLGYVVTAANSYVTSLTPAA